MSATGKPPEYYELFRLAQHYFFAIALDSSVPTYALRLIPYA